MIQEFKITVRNNENVGSLSPEQVQKFTEIFTALIASGGLTGVRGGKTIIHFGPNAEFMGIELDYWPFRRRKNGP